MQFGLETCITEILCLETKSPNHCDHQPLAHRATPAEPQSEQGSNNGCREQEDQDEDEEAHQSDLLSAKHLAQYQATKSTEDLPGLGQFYCVECAKWFEGENSQRTHLKGKNHKRRVKALKDEPYSQKEAEAAVGLRTDNGPPRTSMSKPQTIEVEMAT
ncbi:hypothetical protein V502_02858 [Pseudogymnoascus sp. VKM F-4520 (FW-2644)]|nr:hypothetical protein V502_02858 [Pseudogymnoascus sp. VKM F-4520 (FW-2644)]